MEKNNLEKYLSDQAQDMETMPRKLVWEALSKQLDGVAQQQDVVNNPKAKKVAHKAPLRKWALAAMVAGLQLSPFVWNLRTTPTDTVNERSRTTPAAIVNTHSTTPTIGVTGATIKAPSLVVSNSAQQLILEQGIDHSTATKVVAKKTFSTSSADLRLAQEQTLSSVLPNMHDPSDVEEGLAVVLSPEMEEYAPFKKSHLDNEITVLLAQAITEMHKNPQEAIALSKGLMAQDSAYLAVANELLFEVEKDLNTTFRAKVIQELKLNVIKLSQSMAQTPNN